MSRGYPPGSLPNVQYMHKIHARLYFFPQRAIYVQDCTSLLNVQYIHKIAGIILRNVSHIMYLL